VADRIATFGGSWTFLVCFGALLALWIGINSAVLIWRPVDPYPFILLKKIDHLVLHQWDRLVAIQEVQRELLSEIGRRHWHTMQVAADRYNFLLRRS